MAVVYRAARDIGGTTQVAALKLMTIGALVGLGRERFLREQSILTRLDHPNIAALLDAGVLADGTPWLAMVLVEGERIDSWCRDRRLDSREIVEVFLSVCSAVAYAHRSLIVHRDLKPSNILVGQDGRARLLDFGIARLIDDDSAADATATVSIAETMLRRLLEEIDKQQLTDSQLHLDALNALGTALALQQRAYPEQAGLHEKRLSITRKLDGADSGQYAYALADSVPTFRKAGQIARAEAVAREAVSIADKVYKKPHMYAAVANCNLAAMHQHQGRLADAATIYDRSIAMDEAIGRTDLHAESCRRDRAYVRAARGDFPGSRADLKIDQEMLERGGKNRSVQWALNCAIQASMLVREQHNAEASETLDRCEREHWPEPAVPVDPFEIARAEIDVSNAAWDKARTRLDALRERLPPTAATRLWLRPCVLSVGVAGATGDEVNRDQLLATIRSIEAAPGMAKLEIASACLERNADIDACRVMP